MEQHLDLPDRRIRRWRGRRPSVPPPFAFVSQWLPSGATVTSLRDTIYFPDYEHARPIVVLMAWAAGLFVVMLVVSQRLRASRGVSGRSG
jgi:hypothetical protein